MSDKLPTPATAQDMYAYATVLELRRLNASLEALTAILSNPPPPGEVVLREPEQKPKPKRG